MIQQIFNDDCLSVLPLIESKSIDMILCDLPYGKTACKWDIILAFDRLFNEYDRVIKNTGVIALFGMGTFSVDLINAYRHNYRYSLIWEKTTAVGFLNANKMPLRNHEDILIFYKQLPTYNPQMSKGKPYIKKSSAVGSNCYDHKPKIDLSISNGDRFPTSVLKFKSATGNNQHDKTKSKHPTQKPVELLEYLIKTYSNEGDLILDNCAGSGSTGVACQNSKRQYILIEKDTHYYLAARERLQKNQQRLGELLFY